MTFPGAAAVEPLVFLLGRRRLAVRRLGAGVE
jgi:hypothetical protein